MKKSIAVSALTLILFSCASDNDMKHTDTKKEEVKSENKVGIQNVNGGIPDTTNTINIGNHKTDTTMKGRKDSAK